MEKRFQKKSLQGLLPGRETPDFFFLTAHEHDESWRCKWRCVHVDVREIRDNCGFAYAGQGQIMNLSQISGHVAAAAVRKNQPRVYRGLAKRLSRLTMAQSIVNVAKAVVTGMGGQHDQQFDTSVWI